MDGSNYGIRRLACDQERPRPHDVRGDKIPAVRTTRSSDPRQPQPLAHRAHIRFLLRGVNHEVSRPKIRPGNSSPEVRDEHHLIAVGGVRDCGLSATFDGAKPGWERQRKRPNQGVYSMPPVEPPEVDPLYHPKYRRDAYDGAILLSDQIEYYIKELNLPLFQNPDGFSLGDDELEQCLDAASYKLRLGDEANVGGKWFRISNDQPLILPPHQVAVIKTHEIVNIPRFLIARWNLRVKWVYEGLLWTGGPQVDPGWQGHLYCPIYNLAEREIVIPHKERVFTIDFARTTPFHRTSASYGYSSKPHHGARNKSLQGHDQGRLRSAPFESLKQLESLDTKTSRLDSRITNFSSLTFFVLAVVIAAIGALASLGNGGSDALNQGIKQESTVFVIAVIAIVFGLSGLITGSMAMGSKLGRPPRRNIESFLWSFFGAALLGSGAGYTGVWITSGLPDCPFVVKVLIGMATVLALIIGFVMLSRLWLSASATDAEPRT